MDGGDPGGDGLSACGSDPRRLIPAELMYCGQYAAAADCAKKSALPCEMLLLCGAITWDSADIE